MVMRGRVVIDSPDSPSPSTCARPVPRNVRASPETTWSARRWMVTTPWSRLSAPPASIATTSPSHGLPVETADGEAGHRADQHHPLDAEVEDAGALGEDLADRGEEQDRAARDARGQDDA